MSKNLTRKGIAFGALVALGASLISGAPASAAVTTDIVTELNGGTSFNSVVGYGNDLSLKTTFAPAQASNAATLTYHVENPSGAVVGINVSSTATRLDGGAQNAEIWDTESTPAISSVDADSVEAGTQTTLRSFNVVLKGTSVGTSSLDNIVSLDVKDSDLDVALSVYSWLDTSSGAANSQASTEAQGNTVDLKFYDQKNVTATSEIVSPVTGAAYVESKFTTTPELNGQQLGADFVDGSWTTQGNSNAVLAKNTSSDALTATSNRGTTTYSGTTKKWTSKVYLAFSQANDAFGGTDFSHYKYSIPGASSTNTVTHTATASRATLRLDALDFSTVPTGGLYGTATYAITSTVAHTVSADLLEVAGTHLVIADIASPAATTATETRQFVAGESQIEFWSKGTYASVQASGIYSATPYIGTQKLGAAGSSTNSAITADDTKASVSVSENVAGASSDSGTGVAVAVRTGTTSVDVKATVYYTDADTAVAGKVAPAGIPVTGTLTVTSGTFQINAAGAGVLSKVLYTDANGQVTFTVSTTTASSTSNAVKLQITPQSVAANTDGSAEFDLSWADATYKLFDLNDTYSQESTNSHRRVATSGTYTYNFAVLDQWGKAADAAKYRLQVINSGRTVSSNTHTLSNGRVSVGVADGAQGSGSTIQSQVNVQKLVSETWTTQADLSWDGTGLGYAVINVADAATESISVGADGWTTFTATRSNGTVDLADDIAAKAVVAQDRRVSALTRPSYSTGLVVAGRVLNKTTGLAQGGAVVTVSGPASVLFSAGNVDALGSITVIADNDGYVNVEAFSTTSQEDAVITFTSASGATKTQKVTFNAAGAYTGEKLVITASEATPGKTLVFTGKLTDKWGNGVKSSSTSQRAGLTVTYTGPGLLSGALPTETDADGVFTVRVLLGTSDTGSAVVKATYGAANGTISSADTGANIDIVATATAVIGGAVSASTAAVSGSTGKFYVSVSNAAAKKVVIKVAGKFVKSFTGTAAKKTVVTKSTKGSKKVTVFVGGKLVATKTVTVK